MKGGETYIHMFLCKKKEVLIAFYFSGSTLCSLYILTPNRPVILGGNDTILLAPYHTFYSNVEEHMNKVGVGSSRNLWDQPLCTFQRCDLISYIVNC
jgi:TBCC domain-containing protein 1